METTIRNGHRKRQDRWNTKQLIGWSTFRVGRAFKPLWSLDYSAAKQAAFELCNRIRRELGVPEYSFRKFEEGCQYQPVFSENYRTARCAFVDVVFGWW